MAYVDPNTVTSPRSLVADVDVIWSGGPWTETDPDWSGWAAAKLLWDGRPAVGLRWNGHDGEPGVGNPQSRGLPTWFIVPAGLADIVLRSLIDHRESGPVEQAPVTPRQRLLDLIIFVRSATDEELSEKLAEMGLRARNPQPLTTPARASGPPDRG